MKRLIDEAYADAKRIIDENRPALERLANALIEKETMDGREVERILSPESTTQGDDTTQGSD